MYIVDTHAKIKMYNNKYLHGLHCRHEQYWAREVTQCVAMISVVSKKICRMYFLVTLRNEKKVKQNKVFVKVH